MCICISTRYLEVSLNDSLVIEKETLIPDVDVFGRICTWIKIFSQTIDQPEGLCPMPISVQHLSSLMEQ